LKGITCMTWKESRGEEKKMISLLLSVCFVVSLSTMNVSAAVPASVQIIMDISTAVSLKNADPVLGFTNNRNRAHHRKKACNASNPETI